MHLAYRKSCRVCGSTALTPVISLGSQYLQGSFVKPGKVPPPSRLIPISLVRCDPGRDEKACGLLQMEHTVSPEILYSSYWYRSGTNETMRGHLREIAETAARIHGRGDARVLDIGCNDGTLLSFHPRSFERFGVDPSDVAREIPEDVATVVHDVFPSEELVSLAGGSRFDIVTSIAMFYDLEDPVAFADGIRRILAPGGVWILEMSYMPAMLRMNSYDTICHEHLEYYSLAVVERVLRASGLRVFNVEQNEINGGSIRCYATHAGNFGFRDPGYNENLQAMRRDEFDLMLDTDRPYKHFQDRIDLHRESLLALLKRLKGEGSAIHVYGASTKGNTTLQYCGVTPELLPAIADRNEDKWGSRTVGTDIPIISEAESRKQKPDYYLVLPWHFIEEFKRREREFLNRGGQFVLPMPTVQLVGK